MNFLSLFQKKPDPFYTCSCCGKTFNEQPLCFGWDAPNYFYSVPENERQQRVELEKSLCVIDNEQFFHRGRLTIPIIDYHENLIFNVWTSISQQNFAKRMDLWNDPERTNEDPYFGWMESILPDYESTLHIKMKAIEKEPDVIPAIECIEEGHQLLTDQNNGITFMRAKEIISSIICRH